MEEATFLTRFASKVTLIHRREEFAASKVMYERAVANEKIEIRTFQQVKSWLSDESGLTGAVLEDPRDGTTTEIAVTGAFIAIGHTPITAFLEGQLDMDEHGYLLHKEHTMTSVDGIFAAGDVVDTRYRQAITAAGMGVPSAHRLREMARGDPWLNRIAMRANVPPLAGETPLRTESPHRACSSSEQEALGSPARMYLTAAGVGRIGLVDDDVVDLTNLQRQILHGVKDVGRLKVESGADRLRGLDPDVIVEVHPIRLDAENALSLIEGWDLSSMGPIESVHATSSTARVRSSGSHGFTPPSFGSRAE